MDRNTKLSELDALIDDRLQEFGSMGQKRLQRVSAALRKKLKPSGENLRASNNKMLYKTGNSLDRMMKKNDRFKIVNQYADPGKAYRGK